MMCVPHKISYRISDQGRLHWWDTKHGRERRYLNTKSWLRNPDERDHVQDLNVEGMITLN